MRSLSVLHVSSYFQKKKKKVCGRPTEQAISALCFVRGVWRRGKLESGFPLEAEIYQRLIVSPIQSQCFGSIGHCCWRQTVRVCPQSLLRMLGSLSDVV